MYNIGDYIMKSTSGVCKVDDIVQLDFCGSDKDKLYYMLTPIEEKKGKVYIPITSNDDAMRKVMTEEEAKDLIGQIEEISETSIKNERWREQSYKDALQSNKPEEWVGVIKMLYWRKKERIESGKKTAAVDDKYFRLFENNLYSELAFVLSREKQEMKEYVIKQCKKRRI